MKNNQLLPLVRNNLAIYSNGIKAIGSKPLPYLKPNLLGNLPIAMIELEIDPNTHKYNVQIINTGDTYPKRNYTTNRESHLETFAVFDSDYKMGTLFDHFHLVQNLKNNQETIVLKITYNTFTNKISVEKPKQRIPEYFFIAALRALNKIDTIPLSFDQLRIEEITVIYETLLYYYGRNHDDSIGVISLNDSDDFVISHFDYHKKAIKRLKDIGYKGKLPLFAGGNFDPKNLKKP
jgi:hypothetical protein